MSMFNLFTPKKEETQVQTQAEQAKPADTANPNDPKKDSENPLDAYQKMFENASKNSGIQAPSFAIDPAVLSDVSSKMDFTKGINPELVQKATAGDANAMIQLIQETGRNAYRASLEHATKLTDTHLGQRSEYESQRLQKGVKEQLTSDALSSNTNFNHPVVKSELNRIAQGLANSPEFADASPQEIAKAAKKYFDDVYSAINPADPSKDSAGKPKPKDINYADYLMGN